MGEDWAAIDIAGGSENLSAVGPALAASDIAVICVPPDADAAVLAAPGFEVMESETDSSLVDTVESRD